MFYIYKTINLINNKIYIGQTTKNDPYYLGGGLYLVRAIRKYGKSNFKIEIIQKCNSLIELNKVKKYWIKTLKSQDKNIGYNIANGGNSIGKHSKITKEKQDKLIKIKNELKNLKKKQVSLE